MCGSSIRRMAFVIRTLFLINGSFSTPQKKPEVLGSTPLESEYSEI